MDHNSQQHISPNSSYTHNNNMSSNGLGAFGNAAKFLVKVSPPPSDSAAGAPAPASHDGPTDGAVRSPGSLAPPELPAPKPKSPAPPKPATATLSDATDPDGATPAKPAPKPKASVDLSDGASDKPSAKTAPLAEAAPPKSKPRTGDKTAPPAEAAPPKSKSRTSDKPAAPRKREARPPASSDEEESGHTAVHSKKPKDRKRGARPSVASSDEEESDEEEPKPAPAQRKKQKTPSADPGAGGASVQAMIVMAQRRIAIETANGGKSIMDVPTDGWLHVRDLGDYRRLFEAIGEVIILQRLVDKYKSLYEEMKGISSHQTAFQAPEWKPVDWSSK